jgi:hypothetical protein
LRRGTGRGSHQEEAGVVGREQSSVAASRQGRTPNKRTRQEEENKRGAVRGKRKLGLEGVVSRFLYAERRIRGRLIEGLMGPVVIGRFVQR